MSSGSLKKSQPSSKAKGLIKGLFALVALGLGIMLLIGLVSAALGLLLWPAFSLVDRFNPSYMEVAVGVYCVQVVLCPCYVAVAVASRGTKGLPGNLHGSR